jgi:spoIIIJ-associated protein
VYDENTLLVEFTGPDAALMIGKEGYRYKALSYMLFNWINAVYGMQLRLEIAEFLKNQEESISRYLINILRYYRSRRACSD